LKLEQRLANHTGGASATVANAALGIALALLAHGLPAGTLCMVRALDLCGNALFYNTRRFS
jgi:hypothetical protein